MSKIAVFGTFDIFHPGHVSFLKQARALGSFLLVVVARDLNVRVAKGKFPQNSEIQRLREVRRSKLADKVILGSKSHNYSQTLRTYNIDKIVLGYDQKPTIFTLKKELKKHRLRQVEITRVKAYNPGRYKSSKLKSAKLTNNV